MSSTNIVLLLEGKDYEQETLAKASRLAQGLGSNLDAVAPDPQQQGAPQESVTVRGGTQRPGHSLDAKAIISELITLPSHLRGLPVPGGRRRGAGSRAGWPLIRPICCWSAAGITGWRAHWPDCSSTSCPWISRSVTSPTPSCFRPSADAQGPARRAGPLPPVKIRPHPSPDTAKRSPGLP